MGKPPGAEVSSLASQRHAKVGDGFVIGEEDAAFACGHLFVGVKRERADMAEGADLAVIDDGAEGFAGIFEAEEIFLQGQIVDFVDAGGIAKDLDRDNRFGLGSDFFLHLSDIDVVGDRVDVGKDRLGADHEDDIGGGDEAVGGGDDLIAGPDAPGDQGELQGAGAAVDGDGVFTAYVAAEGLLEFGKPGTQAQAGSFQDLDNGVDVGLADVGGRKINFHRETSPWAKSVPVKMVLTYP